MRISAVFRIFILLNLSYIFFLERERSVNYSDLFNCIYNGIFALVARSIKLSLKQYGNFIMESSTIRINVLQQLTSSEIFVPSKIKLKLKKERHFAPSVTLNL